MDPVHKICLLTHPDHGKLQIPDRFPVHRKAQLYGIPLRPLCARAASRDADAVFVNHSGPVSYTHLDVYKRQDRRSRSQDQFYWL